MKDTYKSLNLINDKDIKEMMASKDHANATIKVLNCLCPLFKIEFKNDDKIIHLFSFGNISLAETISETKIDTLTRNNCIRIQLLLEEVSRECLIYLSRSLTHIYDFIDNFVQLRIAVALYSDKTGYNIRRIKEIEEEY